MYKSGSKWAGIEDKAASTPPHPSTPPPTQSQHLPRDRLVPIFRPPLNPNIMSSPQILILGAAGYIGGEPLPPERH
jgi:hypothetical protein